MLNLDPGIFMKIITVICAAVFMVVFFIRFYKNVIFIARKIFRRKILPGKQNGNNNL